MFSSVDPVLAEQEANAAEMRRLAAQEERRSTKSPGGRTNGFTLRRWRLVGVNGAESVEAVLDVLEDLATNSDRNQALSDALAGEPDENLMPAVVHALRESPPEAVLRHLRRLWEARIEWLTPEATRRLSILCSTAPERRLVHTPHTGDAGAPYELFVSVVTNRPTRHIRERLRAQLAALPISLVDTLIDIGALDSSDRPWNVRPSEEGPYLRARTDPQLLSAAEAEGLAWPAFDRRHAFVSGWVLPETTEDDHEPDVYEHLESAAAGETHHLGELELMLPEPQRVALRDLRSYCSLGTWPPHLLADRGLWLLMEALWRPVDAIDPRLSGFHAWAALRRARHLIQCSHHQSAAAQTNRLLRVGKASPEYRAEILNLVAYQAFCNNKLAEAAQALREALDILTPLDHESQPTTVSAARIRLESNLAVVERRKTTKKNDRSPSANPFLELGLPHGTLSWEELYRELTKEALHDTQERARLNSIRARIEATLRMGEAEAGTFVLPHDERPYRDPDERSGLLVPPLPRLGRRTPHLTADDVDDIRAHAAVGLLEHFLTAPPRVGTRRRG
ncbi:hypothetical protein [Kitasatospora indigofera]|uniref:hypothetical protein n=1 Tax=Kitasatospora indigofera TaxID=67307 RepID=UPI0036C9803D